MLYSKLHPLPISSVPDPFLEDYLKYINSLPSDGAQPPPNLTTLKSVVTNHAKHIPYSNLGVHYPRTQVAERLASVDPEDPSTNTNPSIQLDLPILQTKLLKKSQGGYCLENNLTLAAALSALGFTVLLRTGQVILGSTTHELALQLPHSHLFLIVGVPLSDHDDGSEIGPFETPSSSEAHECASWWLCDNGSGNLGPSEPIAFRRGGTGQGHFGRTIVIDLVEWANTERWVLFYRHAPKETPQPSKDTESLNAREPDPRGGRFYMWAEEEIDWNSLERMNQLVSIPSRCPPGDLNELVSMIDEDGGGIMVIGKESNGWKVVTRNSEGEEVESYAVDTLDEYRGELKKRFGLDLEV
ncbi:hypothetical protein BJ742DRAFT_389836 [Cladochytrium replicatum]|nr:hypothetical protein BJ742DRAFT_389836 [Cladochytrium replicatum]